MRIRRLVPVVLSAALMLSAAGCGGGGDDSADSGGDNATTTTAASEDGGGGGATTTAAESSGEVTYDCPAADKVGAILGKPADASHLTGPGGECAYKWSSDPDAYLFVFFGGGQRSRAEQDYNRGLDGAKEDVAEPSSSPNHTVRVKELSGIGERAYVEGTNPRAGDPPERLDVNVVALQGSSLVRVSSHDPKGLFSANTDELETKSAEVLKLALATGK